MHQLITNVPTFVWILLFILLSRGLKATVTRRMPLKKLLLLPAIFFVWSLYSFFEKYSLNPFAIVFWSFCLGLGLILGFSYSRKLKLRFDKQNKEIEMPGNWMQLILSMTIFALKFFLGVMRSMFPDQNGSILFLGIELLATLITGIFVGRAIGCFFRYQTSSEDVV